MKKDLISEFGLLVGRYFIIHSYPIKIFANIHEIFIKCIKKSNAGLTLGSLTIARKRTLGLLASDVRFVNAEIFSRPYYTTTGLSL